MIYGSLRVLVAVGSPPRQLGEKKALRKSSARPLRHRRNGRTEKEVIGVPCILFRRVACITTVAEIEKRDFSERDEI